MHRKSEVRIQILNPDGSPASGRRIHVDQTAHRFLFGCGAFDSVALMKTQDSEKKAFLTERMNKWLALFNYGTLPFYWGRYEPVEGTTAYTETMAAARWLKEHGVRVKGHPFAGILRVHRGSCSTATGKSCAGSWSGSGGMYPCTKA